MTIKYHFFGKECLTDRNLVEHSDLNANLAKQNFSLNQPAIFVNQTHSNEVTTINKQSQIYSIENRPKADAIVTNLKNLTLAIFTADCVPVLLFDQTHSIIAIAHCGWRGALSNITKNTIAKMIDLGAKINNIQTIIGPCIRQKSYQISREFYDNFLNERRSNDKFFIADNKPNHFMFDLPSYVKEKLIDEGIKNISDDEIDTYGTQEQFFSYRKSAHLDKKDCGRNISAIQIKY